MLNALYRVFVRSRISIGISLKIVYDYRLYLLNYTNGNILCSVAVIKLQIERRMIMANIENKESTNNPINKTTETLIKELETMSDAGLHDLFIFF